MDDSMDDNMVYDRPSLGQEYDLGTVYDAHRDIFKDANIIRGSPPPAAVGQENLRTLEVRMSPSGTMQDKFNKFGMYNELAASFIANLVPASGSASYLSQAPPEEGVAEGFVFAEILTETVSLNLTCPRLQDCITTQYLRDKNLTHVVSGITFGVHVVICGQQALSGAGVTQEDMAEKLDHIVAMVSQHIRGSTGGLGAASPVNAANNPGQPDLDGMEFTVFHDFETLANLNPAKFTSVQELIHNIPSLLDKTNHGRGVPITYHLAPLDDLRSTYGFQFGRVTPLCQTPDWLLERLFAVWEKWEDLECKIKRCIRDMGSIDFMFTGPGLARFSQTLKYLRDALRAKDDLQVDVESILIKLRSDQCSADLLDNLLHEYLESSASPDRVPEILSRASGEVSLRKALAIHGGKYLDYDDAQNAISAGGDIYVMFFTDQMTHDESSWRESQSVVMNLLNRNIADYHVVVAECNPSEIPFSKPRISFYSHGEVAIPDMVETMDLADQCFMKRQIKSTVDKAQTPPRERRLVNLPCACHDSVPQDWTCYHCRRVLEYHEKFFYCDCGRTNMDDSTWQCNAEAHGKKFIRWESQDLEAKLQSINSPKEMNILVLGESGVGKSTFINAFFNHMMFDSLDDAMKHEKLEYAIPSSFTIQYIDESQPDGDIIEKDVKIGQDDEERDGSIGQSATQSPTVYRIPVGDRLIRLIDTPGIGDTRGEKFDRINMSKILSTLNQFSSLHGILILVKPNNARLNVIFKFCVQELLTYLHRDAVRNIVWGFTNTRQSNYMPGDSFKPLKNLLAKHQSLGLELTSKRVYCFDSESFRCLATKKKIDYTMPNMSDFRNSWDHSTKQTRSLLNHIESLEPHRVKSTLSINRAREVIAELTRPIADITDNITRTIRMNQEKIKDLDSAELQGKSLEDLLHFDRIEIEVKRLEKPRTVCKHASCVDIKDVAGVKRPIYKSICHNNCSLKEVEEDVVGHSEMLRCWAFNLKRDKRTGRKIDPGHCRVCGHHWQNHLHIRYSQTEKVVRDIDADVQGKIEANASAMVIKKSAIETLEKKVTESQKTLKEFQDAAIRFGLYLKKKSIVPYNDAMIAYLDMLIKDEREQINHAKSLKMDAAKNEERLESLAKSKKRYAERIKILETEMSKSDDKVKLLDEEGVDELVQKLFNLKHWGKDLQAMQEMVEWSKASGFREQELRPRIVRSRPKHVARPRTPTRVSQAASLFSNAVSSAASTVTRGIFGGGGGGRQRNVYTIESSPSPSPTPAHGYHQRGESQRSATLEADPSSSSSQAYQHRGVKRTYSQNQSVLRPYSHFTSKKTRRY
ncbi:hypothetical protein PG993_011486 [Apiospora rasikravindrae]|uniref:G domain-containing protein n=1 Tax=Apiospora rasikravindrae TaxID=990691 RepID=A0ABR1SFP5_9PEZI